MVTVREDPYGFDSCYDDSDTSLFNVGLRILQTAHPAEDSLLKEIREMQKIKVSIAEPQECELDAIITGRIANRSVLGIDEPRRMSSKRLEIIMTPLEIVLMCPLLEECIRKLSIVTSHCPQVTVYFDFLDIYERFSDNRMKSLVDRDNIPANEKFAQDVGRLQKLIRMIKDDLQFEEHDFLKSFILCTHMKVVKFLAMKQSNKKLSKRLTNLKADIMQLHNLAESTKKSETSLSLYRQEIYDEKAIKIGTLVEYIRKYDKGRIEQNRLKLEQNLKNELGKAQVKRQELEEEMISHEAIMAYCKRSQTELEASIDFWEKKYIKDMEEIGLSMDVLEEEIGENSSYIQRLLEAFKRKKMQIDVYEKEKESMLENETLEEVMETLLLTLKSWWRGTMVRWDLGRYNPQYEKLRQQEEKAAVAEMAAKLAAGLQEEEERSSSEEEDTDVALELPPAAPTTQEQEAEGQESAAQEQGVGGQESAAQAEEADPGDAAS